MEKNEFIIAIATAVKKYAQEYEIFIHSPIIAQAILESNWGNSQLAAKHYNYFGLKCGYKWIGKSVNMKTREEYTTGTLTVIKDNFRVYDNLEEGVKGYFEFIQMTRYHNLKGITDAKMYLDTLKKDGYATSSTYVANTMRIIEQYNLTQYDKMGVNDTKLARAIVDQANAWIGRKEADGTHKEIIDLYNSKKPLARGYAVKYTDEWCATFVSAVAIKCGCVDIIPTECSCSKMIEHFISLGAWEEDDARTPNPGDIIFYDWNDNGIGDNTGWSDHVGIVEQVRNNTITVIEGNILNAVGRRTIAVNGRCIRGYGVPHYTKELIENNTTKDLEIVAKEVIRGLWGTGSERKAKLEIAGYNYKEVQAKVNTLLK